MFLKQIEAFVSIIKYKSFSKAAKTLHLSQPTISSYMKSLESELGVLLIVRTSNGIFLSEAGDAFYKYAINILNVRNNAYMELQKYSGNVKGTVHIVSSTFASQYILPGIAVKVIDAHPALHFKIDQRDSEDVITCMENSGADFGIVELVPDAPNYRSKLITKEPLVLVTPNTPKYQAYNGVFPIETLAEEPMILRFQGNSIRTIAGNYLSSIGISENDIRIIAEMETMVGIVQAVRANIGVTFAAKRRMEDFVREGSCLTFDLHSDILYLPQNVIYHKDKLFTPAANYLLQQLLDKTN